MASNRKAAVGFIFITILLDVMGWGLIIPVMPDLLSELKNKPINEASSENAWLIAAYALTQFFFAPVIGNLSDRYGRRPILLLSLLGFGIDYLFLAIAPTYGWLFIGRAIAGVTGASFTTASAYIADVSTNETRAKNFGMIGAAFGLGFILGPLIGGLLSGFGIRAPFYAAAALCLLNALYGFFVLPESLSPENRRPFEWKRANPFGAFIFIKKNPAIIGLCFAFFLIYMGAQSVMANWNFFTEYRFHWTPKMVGLSLGVVGLLVAGVQGGLTRVVNPKIGNEKSIYVGLTCYITGLILFAFATQGWMMFLFLVPYCLGGLCGPSLQAILAGHVSSNQQGELQGAMTSIMSVTTILGPLLMNNLFEYFSTGRAPIYFPGIPFLVGAVFMLLSLIISKRILSKEKREHPQLAKAIDAKAPDDSNMH